tara:strand:+ start:55 stop:327 length:273 start_codon:yes stop_codon:yes gene_type:complete
MKTSFDKALLTVSTLALCVIAVELIPFSRNQKLIGICNSLKGYGRDLELGYKHYSKQEMELKVEKMKKISRRFEKMTGFASSNKACEYLF